MQSNIHHICSISSNPSHVCFCMDAATPLIVQLLQLLSQYVFKTEEAIVNTSPKGESMIMIEFSIFGKEKTNSEEIVYKSCFYHLDILERTTEK